MGNFGTILLGNPAQEVTDRVTQIAILEKQYKIVDWIDDMKSNQLGQLHAIYKVSAKLYSIESLGETVLTQVASIGNSSIKMHDRINGEHARYHAKAAALRAQIAELVNQIKAIVEKATNDVNVDTSGLAGVKKDQAEINAKRSKLLTIIGDNEDTINEKIKYDSATEPAPAVAMAAELNKMDYTDIDQTANIDRTTDPEEDHQHVINDDHHSTDGEPSDAPNMEHLGPVATPQPEETATQQP